MKKAQHPTSLPSKIINKIQWRFFNKLGRTQEENDKNAAKVYIISYPKSGRTWLRLLIGKVLCDRYNLDEANMLNTITLTLKAGVLATNWIHDGSGLGEAPNYFRYNHDKSMFRDKKVIFLCREPKDVLVSSYFHATRRVPEFSKFEGNISEFIRHPKYGATKVVKFYNLWHEKQNIPEDFLLITYEEMHSDIESVLKKVLAFLEITDVEDTIIKQAIEFSDFKNMKKMEKTNQFNEEIMQSANQQDTESSKVRKGKVGGYAEYLSQDDIEYIDNVIARLGCPFYGVEKP